MRARNDGARMSATQLIVAFFILCAAGAILPFLTPQRWLTFARRHWFARGADCLDSERHAASVWYRISFRFVASVQFRNAHLEADPLSAFFLFVTGLVFLPVSIFSGTYLTKYLAHHDLRYFSVLYHALFASIVLVFIAGDVISFLVAWELMSIASYLLVNYEFERAESSRAGYVMLAMSEGGTIAVAIAFIMIAGATGGLASRSCDQLHPPLAMRSAGLSSCFRSSDSR